MSGDEDSALRRIVRTLQEVGHALEGVDGVNERIVRTLELTREIVPYQRCALLRLRPNAQPVLHTVPAVEPQERDQLARTLARVLRMVAQAEEIGRSSDDTRHLTLPLIGLDEVLGVLRLEPVGEAEYGAHQVRLLSVIIAQLGSYLAMLKLHDEDAQHTAEIAAAHDFQQLLVGVVSHDLRNPLSVVRTSAETLLRTSTDPQQTRSLDRALRSAQKATRLINDLLDVTHARVTGTLPINRQRSDLRAVVLEVVEEVRVGIPDRQVLVELPQTADVVGEWDADRLSQVTNNLLNNALQHGDPQRPVVVRVTQDDATVTISVHNEGPTIPAEQIPVIFNPFTGHSRSQRRAGGGLGLGLFIVDHIVRSHGGTVTVTSTAGEGTTFSVVLPRSADAAVAGSLSRGR